MWLRKARFVCDAGPLTQTPPSIHRVFTEKPYRGIVLVQRYFTIGSMSTEMKRVQGTVLIWVVASLLVAPFHLQPRS